MIILGIDPGLATIGYGVIEAKGTQQKVIDYGVISTPPKIAMPQRLKMIYRIREPRGGKKSFEEGLKGMVEVLAAMAGGLER